MGTNAVLDRLRQTEPKALIAVDGVFYAGKAMDRSMAVAEIRRQLPSIEALFVIATGCGENDMPGAIAFGEAVGRDDDEGAAFGPDWMQFDHPLGIFYSSGTSALPTTRKKGVRGER